MKKSIALLIIAALFYSCNESIELVIPKPVPEPEVVEPTPEPEEQEPNEIDTTVVGSIEGFPRMVLVDSEFNDRLNPESSAYWGKAYVNGIKIYSFYKGKRLTPYEASLSITTGGIDPSIYGSPVMPDRKPSRQKDGTVIMVNQNTLGYYFIPWARTWDTFHRDHCMYICYPDGSEDEIKLLLFVPENRSRAYIDKIWANGELVYAMSENDKLYWDGKLPDSIDPMEPDNFLKYYNPKYYPWLEPVPGKDVGSQVRPVNATDIIVITK